MITKQHKEIAQWSIEFARQNGCQDARVSVITAQNNSFEYRDTQLDKLQQSTENKLYIELFVDNKYGSFSTNKIEKSELEAFLKSGIASTRYLSEDKFRQLPDPKRYYKSKGNDLDLYDKSFDNVDTGIKLELAKATVDEILGTNEKIISVSSYYDDGVGLNT